MERDALAESYKLPANHGWQDKVAEAVATKKSWFWRMVSNAKRRSARRGHEDTLTPEELRDICLRSDGRCEVSGLPFSDGASRARRLQPLVPTLDRIDCSIGYTKDNCRLVCGAVNVAMFDWGEEMFLQVVAGTFYNRFVSSAVARFVPQGPTPL